MAPSKQDKAAAKAAKKAAKKEAKNGRGPGKPGALRVLLGALRTSAAHPRIWLSVWVVVTVPAVLAVYSPAARMDAVLAHHPGALPSIDLALDADFARHHPDVEVPLVGGFVFVLLAMTLLAGGILLGVGKQKPLRYAAFLADGARLFLRNLRVFALGCVLALLLDWGCESVMAWVEGQVYEVDPGTSLFGWRLLSVGVGLEALHYLGGFLFLGLVFVSKLAMAWLAARGRHSAFLAWGRGAGLALRHPIRFAFVVGAFALLWLGGSHLIGELTVYLLEVQELMWLGLASGQLVFFWDAILLVAAFVVAREFLAMSTKAPAQDPRASSALLADRGGSPR